MRFTVTVRTVKGWRFELEVEDTDTVESLKFQIKEKDGIPPDQQRIIFEGRELKDGRCLSDYSIQHGSIVKIILRLKGGGLPEKGDKTRSREELSNFEVILTTQQNNTSVTPRPMRSNFNMTRNPQPKAQKKSSNESVRKHLPSFLTSF